MIVLYLLSYLLASFAILVNGLPQQLASFDPIDPDQADPTTLLSSSFSIPQHTTPEPFKNGNPTLPDVCEPPELSEDCLKALEEQNGQGCDDNQQTRLKEALWDAQDLLRLAARWSPIGPKNDVLSVRYWMGEDWKAYQDRIKGNLGRASDFVNKDDWKKYYITMTCQDPKQYCELEPEGKKVGGYAWDVAGVWYTYGHITMCDTFYLMDDIEERVHYLDWLRERGDYSKLQDMRYYRTSGQVFVHEMMHLRSTWYPEPMIVDMYYRNFSGEHSIRRAYGPRLVHALANGDSRAGETGIGAAFSTLNADSYALLANSMFWADKTGILPGVPRDLDEDEDDNAGSSDSPPPLLVFPHASLENDTTFSMQMVDDELSKVFDEELATEGGESQPLPPDDNICHGIGGDYWVMSRDIAVENVQAFCAQASPILTYNAGSVNELQLSVTTPNGDPADPLSAPDCVGRFVGAVIDGCDGGDPLNNPHNYKFGSTLIAGDGWQYRMRPLSKQVNEVNCDVSYKFFLDSFEIRGKNWPDATLGANGEGLHAQLSGCGAVTKWKFETTPDDCCFQWYASGQLPMGTRSCVGNAVQSAGGSGKDKCHGPGKRTANGTDAIDRWPGYGDDSKHVFRNGD